MNQIFSYNNEDFIPKKKISSLDNERTYVQVYMYRSHCTLYTVEAWASVRPWQRSGISIQESNLISKNSVEGTQEASIFEAPPFKMHYAGRRPTNGLYAACMYGGQMKKKRKKERKKAKRKRRDRKKG